MERGNLTLTTRLRAGHQIIGEVVRPGEIEDLNQATTRQFGCGKDVARQRDTLSNHGSLDQEQITLKTGPCRCSRVFNTMADKPKRPIPPTASLHQALATESKRR